ncbi:DUF559 domain-containing protein [Nocardioides sambongensis]|uniref:DUF559 domain-containing protein n=1 Tax=Nocardioides sambongensis TaxID=2589074 RepID=UPI001E36CB25|nr:DUF559 domain-containing protein [Nocardioides sambongensis]
MSSDVEDTTEVRAAALALLVPAHQIVVDRTAAWLHGVDTFPRAELTFSPPLETCALRGNTRARLAGVRGRTRDLAAGDLTSIAGVRATNPVRTALDLGCALHQRDAYAAMNRLAGSHGFGAADLAVHLPRYVGRRGVVQLRALVPLVDPRPESPRESWTLLELLAAGLPKPELQYVVAEDGRYYRLDFAYPAQRVCIEYDGAEFHDLTDRQRRRDEERRGWLRRRGWTVIVVRNGDFTGDRLPRWLSEVRAALSEGYSNRRW